MICLALCFALAGQAAAAEGGISFTVNGTPLAEDVRSYAEDGTTYVSYGAILFALYPDAVASWADGQAVVTAEGLTMHIRPGARYIEANGRYLYVPDGVRSEDGAILVPVLMPVVTQLGIDPVHFGIFLVLTNEVALLSPPLGVNLFVSSRIADIPVESVVVGILPYIGVLIVCTLIVAFIPEVSLFLPRLFGY